MRHRPHHVRMANSICVENVQTACYLHCCQSRCTRTCYCLKAHGLWCFKSGALHPLHCSSSLAHCASQFSAVRATPAVQYAVLSRTAHLETHTGNISHGVSATTESCNQNLVLQTDKWAQSSSTVSKMQNSACSPGPARRCALRASHDSKQFLEGGRIHRAYQRGHWGSCGSSS